VAIESGAFLGIGATVIQNLRIGYDSVVGAGSVVIEDVEPMTTVVGVPARVIRNKPVFDPAVALEALKPAAALR
jgi:serine O-acetyltransferase